MIIKTKTRTEQILTVMLVLAWIAYIGSLIKVGAILISYGVSFVNPEASKNLFMGDDLSDLRQLNFWYYTMSVSFMVAFSGMKAYVASLVVKTLSKVNMINPFTAEVAGILERISYVLFGTWMVATFNNGFADWLMKNTEVVHELWEVKEFIFIAGLVFIISQIFKRGVEIQSENDLTV
ncbi:MAG: DUF2975 domain-containing protein [Flammeovirgaceae bacterium]|nr:DUF2975 domain-containing protein [Flammeovirgaceae bacterium]